MKSNQHQWVVVLAGGAGTRLSNLTQDGSGDCVPKQYCSLDGGSTLFADTLERARDIAAAERVLAIVDPAHQRWWAQLLGDIPPDNVIEQPANRGTAVGIVLCALHVLARDPDAVVAFLPSDHYIRDVGVISRYLVRGFEHLQTEPDSLVMLGITPDEADCELGYIVPGAQAQDGVFTVARFVEKPDPVLAEDLLAAGSRWNSFIFAARANTISELFRRRFPHAYERIRDALRRDGWNAAYAPALEAAYRNIPSIDFSRDLLEGAEYLLRMLPVPRCGWTDLGTPQRVGKCVQRLNLAWLHQAAHHTAGPYLNLATAYARLSQVA